MTTIPYIKQYDNPITDYLKQYNKLLKQANPNVNELKNLLETFAVHEILIDKHDVTEDELLTHIYILNNQLGVILKTTAGSAKLIFELKCA